ncbi:MAG: AAA family ATPase [Rhodoglobus sp.]
MAKIEGLRIQNYKTLRDVTLGQLSSHPKTTKPLNPLTAVIGKNGVGKSSLFDAFGFLADCLKLGVEEACDANGRGGFSKLRTLGQSGPITIEVYYRQTVNAQPITYEIAVDLDRSGRPYVAQERLRQRRKADRAGRPFLFLDLREGKGVVWKGQSVSEFGEGDAFDFEKLIREVQEEDSKEREVITLTDSRKLGIATLGSLTQHPRISAFRTFIEGWYLSYFTPDAARSLPLAGAQKHLSIHGDNLGNVVQFMQREHPKRFQQILDRIADKIPGISRIDTETSNDGRVLLRFNDHGFSDPFYSQQMSDGTLKVFAYLLLLEDPTPPPFLCIEEPENGLYHRLLETLAEEFRAHATGQKGSSQVFLTTHQPYLVDALRPDEVWILEKQSTGFSEIRRASADDRISNFVDEGLPLGALWYSEYLDA